MVTKIIRVRAPIDTTGQDVKIRIRSLVSTYNVSYILGRLNTTFVVFMQQFHNGKNKIRNMYS